MKKIIFISFFIVVQLFVVAQNPVSRNLTNQTGLPSNTVYNILQDSKGFIWFGHDKGLSRYDGNSFKHFTAPAQQGRSISNLVEINNSIWCQDFSGNFYYTKNEALYKELAFKITGTYSPAGVLNNNVLSVINHDSIKSYNITTKKSNAIASTIETSQANFHDKNYSYFFSNKILKKYDGNNVLDVTTFNTSLPRFSFLLKIDDEFLAFNRNDYPLVYKIQKNNISAIPVLKKGLLIQDVTIINDEIWISTTSGAYCFDKKMNPLYNGHCFFEEHSITKIIKDREGNFWFGTLNKGVIMVADINTKLFKYSTESITALSSFNNENEVLAGTSSNLIFSFNSQNNSFNTIISNETKGEIFSLFYDKPLHTIVSCANVITFYQNGIKVKTEALAGKMVAHINNNAYAIALSGGILLTPKLNTKFLYPNWLSSYVERTNNRISLSPNFRGRSVIFNDATQTLYTATSEGLKYYNQSGSGFVLFNAQPIYASSLSLVNNILFAGTFSDGLLKITNNTANTAINNSSITKTVYKLYAENHYLWITGDDKVQRYNTTNGSVVTYTAADGLPKAEVKDILVQNNITYLATTDGLVLFSSSKNAINKVPPLLQLNKFLVNDIEKLENNELKLKASENNIALQFSVLSFKDNTACTISYKINNEDWKNLPNGLSSLQLASLAPGNYKIEIKAANEDGINVEKNIVVKFTIAAPFYKKLWFIVLIVSLILIAMYIYFKQKLVLQKKSNILLSQKMELEQELHQSMLSSIKSQMNPHFLFNALNTIQSYIYTNEKENASLYLGKFSELTRTILDMSNKERISLAEEIKALQLYIELEQLRFENKLQCNFTVDKAISTETTYIPSMLIQPYVENAIKHGLMHQKNKWLLTISFSKKDTGIEVIIDDNGVGRKASEAINLQKFKKHQSFATGANQKRLAILNKGLPQAISLKVLDKEDEYGNATGTTMILSIPFMQIS